MILLIKMLFWLTVTTLIGIFAEDWALRKWREKRGKLSAQWREQWREQWRRRNW